MKCKKKLIKKHIETKGLNLHHEEIADNEL